MAGRGEGQTHMVRHQVQLVVDGMNAVLAVAAAIFFGTWIRDWAKLRARERDAYNDPDHVKKLVATLAPWGLDSNDYD